VRDRQTKGALVGGRRPRHSLLRRRLSFSLSLSLCVSHTPVVYVTEPCTEGLWVWVVDRHRLDPSVAPKDATVVLLDTEVRHARTDTAIAPRQSEGERERESSQRGSTLADR
jgi:hypothetical protein